MGFGMPGWSKGMLDTPDHTLGEYRLISESVRKVWDSELKNAGLSPFHIYDLRATFASPFSAAVGLRTSIASSLTHWEDYCEAGQMKDFHDIAEALSNEAFLGNVHLDICEGVAEVDPIIGNYAPTFFTYTYYAHLNAAQMYAAKLFDAHPNAVTIPLFLQMCCERKNEFKHATATKVSDCVAKAEVVIQEIRQTIEILHRRRNNFLAHISHVLVFEREKLSQGPPLTTREIRAVLRGGGRIVNDLLFMWCQEAYPISDSNTADYKVVVNMMCDRINAKIDADEAEIRGYGSGFKIPRPNRCE
jgi:hypothetical protein